MKKFPSPNWIIHQLLLGGCDALEDVSDFQSQYPSVSHILCVAEECSCSRHFHKRSNFKHRRLILPDFIKSEDELHNQFAILENAIQFIDEAMHQNKTCYVHCMRGRSRSSTVIICYLMKKKMLSLKEAYLLVKLNRHFIGPHRCLKFIIEKYEEHLLKQNHFAKKQQGQETHVLEVIDKLCDPKFGDTYQRHEQYNTIRTHLEEILERVVHPSSTEQIVSITSSQIKTIELELKKVMNEVKPIQKLMDEEEQELQQKQMKLLQQK